MFFTLVVKAFVVISITLRYGRYTVHHSTTQFLKFRQKTSLFHPFFFKDYLIKILHKYCFMKRTELCHMRYKLDFVAKDLLLLHLKL